MICVKRNERCKERQTTVKSSKYQLINKVINSIHDKNVMLKLKLQADLINCKKCGKFEIRETTTQTKERL